GREGAVAVEVPALDGVDRAADGAAGDLDNEGVMARPAGEDDDLAPVRVRRVAVAAPGKIDRGEDLAVHAHDPGDEAAVRRSGSGDVEGARARPDGERPHQCQEGGTAGE